MIEKILSLLSSGYAIGNLICMAFVRIAQLSNPSLELQATALLHDMSSLMRRRMQVGRGSERHVVPVANAFASMPRAPAAAAASVWAWTSLTS